MKWIHVFIKSAREQVREAWILVMVLLLAPFFISVYYLMIETGDPQFDIVLVNGDEGTDAGNHNAVNLGDSLWGLLEHEASGYESLNIRIHHVESRDLAMNMLTGRKADAMLMLPGEFTACMIDPFGDSAFPAKMEIAGNPTDMEYIVSAAWMQDVLSLFISERWGLTLPVSWTETKIGFSGERSGFELYVPGMLILAVIMMMFSASASIVREIETRSLTRLKLSHLTALSFLAGTSLVQVVISVASVLLALLTAMVLGYRILPGTFWFMLLVSMLTSLSIIAFSLFFAAFCRSVRDVAIIGTFPLLVFMFFTGAALPLNGPVLFSAGTFEFSLNGLLAPSHAINALNKVLVMGRTPAETLPDLAALLALTAVYLVAGIFVFGRKHMQSGPGVVNRISYSTGNV